MAERLHLNRPSEQGRSRGLHDLVLRGKNVLRAIHERAKVGQFELAREALRLLAETKINHPNAVYEVQGSVRNSKYITYTKLPQGHKWTYGRGVPGGRYRMSEFLDDERGFVYSQKTFVAHTGGMSGEFQDAGSNCNGSDYGEQASAAAAGRELWHMLLTLNGDVHGPDGSVKYPVNLAEQGDQPQAS